MMQGKIDQLRQSFLDEYQVECSCPLLYVAFATSDLIIKVG